MRAINADGRSIYVFDNVRTLINNVPGLRVLSSGGETTPTRVRDIPPPFRDTRSAAQSAQTNSYVQTQEHLERREFVADHGHGGGHGGGASTGAANAVGYALALLIGVAAIIWFFNWLLGPKTYTVIDNTPAQIQIVRQPPAVITTGGGATIVSGGGVSVSGMPSPQQVYERQLQSGNVIRTRVPCAAGFDTLPNGNCGRWVPN